MIVSLIVAASANEVIGREGALPWYLPADLRRFRALTTGHVVVMGRLTYQSIVDRLGHPLPDRTSIVVSSTLGDPGYGNVLVVRSLPEALDLAETLAESAGDGEFFIIGGESVYGDALSSVDRVYLTRLHEAVEGDRAMPEDWLAGFDLAAAEHAVDPESQARYSFLDYRRAQR